MGLPKRTGTIACCVTKALHHKTGMQRVACQGGRQLPFTKHFRQAPDLLCARVCEPMHVALGKAHTQDIMRHKEGGCGTMHCYNYKAGDAIAHSQASTVGATICQCTTLNKQAVR